jgi:hypothetical protein
VGFEFGRPYRDGLDPGASASERMMLRAPVDDRLAAVVKA